MDNLEDNLYSYIGEPINLDSESYFASSKEESDPEEAAAK